MKTLIRLLRLKKMNKIRSQENQFQELINMIGEM